MTASLGSTRFGKVVYRVVGAVGDGPDANKTPDAIPITGTGTLTPRVERILDTSTTPAQTILPRPIKVTFHKGNLTYRDDPWVWLPASEAGVWRWHASFVYKVGTETITDEFTFDLPPGNPDDAGYVGTDLSTARLDVDPSTGLPTGIGPAGRSVVDIVVLPDALLFVMSSGVDIQVSVPSIGDLSGAATRAENAASRAETSATTASTGASTATSAATTATTAAGQAGSARDDALQHATAARQSRDDAEAHATNARTRMEAAAGSATTATAAASTATGAATTATSAASTATAAKNDAVDAAAVAVAAAEITDRRAADADASAIAAAASEAAAASAVEQGLAGKANLGPDGKIVQAEIPAIAMVDFLGNVASQAAMLALTGQRGDWCNRTDLGTEWQLIAEPSTSLVSWQQKVYPASDVTSVAGRKGAVTLSVGDVSGAAPLASPQMTGSPKVNGTAVVLDTDTRLTNARDTTVDRVTDATTVGRNMMKATDAATARAAIGAVSASDLGQDPLFSTSRAGGYGSSTLERLAPLLTTRLAGYGIDFHWQTGSVGAGRVSAQVLAAGSLDPGIAAVTIPASGSVAVRPQAMTEDNAPPALSIPGRLGSVDGVLATAAGSSNWTFTRTTAGQAVPLAEGTPFLPARAEEYGGGIQILNLGKNTLTADLPDWDSIRVVELTKRTVERFGGAGRRVLVVGHFQNTNTPSSSPSRGRIEAVNSAYFYAFGNRFFDLGTYLTGETAREDTLYAVTAADTAQRNLGNKPPSLSSDDLHMNALAEAAVVAQLEARMVDLGWLTVPTTITDTFDRANGPLVPGGLPWRTTHGLPLPVISGNALRRPVGASTEAYAVTRRPGGISSDYEVEIEYGTMGATAASKLGQIRVRWRSGENNVMISPRRDGSNEGYSIWKVVNGVLTKMGETPAGAVVAKGGDVVRVRCQGSTYTVWVNGTQRLQVTDANNPVGDIALRFDGPDDSINRFTAYSI